jgi:hypothetical protein
MRWSRAATLEKAMVDASKRRLKRLACYIPVATVGLEFVWIFVLFLALIFSVGDTPYVNTPDKSRFFDTLSAWPVAAGVLFGAIAILFRLPVKAIDWFFLIAGILVCAGLVYVCVHGFW